MGKSAIFFCFSLNKVFIAVSGHGHKRGCSVKMWTQTSREPAHLLCKPSPFISNLHWLRWQWWQQNIKREMLSGHYPIYQKLFHLALSLPAGTTTYKRLFLAVCHIQNWWRTRSQEESREIVKSFVMWKEWSMKHWSVCVCVCVGTAYTIRSEMDNRQPDKKNSFIISIFSCFASLSLMVGFKENYGALTK